MNQEQQSLRLTDLDYLTGDHHLQMMKAALPYMNAPQQRIFFRRHKNSGAEENHEPLQG